MAEERSFDTAQNKTFNNIIIRVNHPLHLKYKIVIREIQVQEWGPKAQKYYFIFCDEFYFKNLALLLQVY
jgi:hypothetical protein